MGPCFPFHVLTRGGGCSEFPDGNCCQLEPFACIVAASRDESWSTLGRGGLVSKLRVWLESEGVLGSTRGECGAESAAREPVFDS